MSRGIVVDIKTPEIAEIVSKCFPYYKGRKVTLYTTESVVCDGAWSGGSRTVSVGYDMANATRLPSIANLSTPVQFGGNSGANVKLEPGFAIVQHVMFCGKDLGIDINIHPDNMNQSLLPVQDNDLSEKEKIVLSISNSLKSFARMEYGRYNGINKVEWESIKTDLITKGYMAKNGAPTIKGKNIPRVEYKQYHGSY